MDDYSLVQFMPLDATDEDSINDVIAQIDRAIQYGEDFEPKEPKVTQPLILFSPNNDGVQSIVMPLTTLIYLFNGRVLSEEQTDN